jgi:hypothetical protein
MAQSGLQKSIGHGDNMSYDADYESVYMVEFESGKTIHVQFFEVDEVKEYCRDMYPSNKIKTIYKEVYNSWEDSDDSDD